MMLSFVTATQAYNYMLVNVTDEEKFASVYVIAQQFFFSSFEQVEM